MVSKTESVVGYFFLDLLGSIPRFPVWWYGRGLFDVIKWAGRSLRYRATAYGFRIWLANFFVPMYGQYDLAGRLMSVFMRFVVFIGRGIAFGVEIILDVVLVCFWAAAPLIFLWLLLQGGLQPYGF